MANNLKDHLKEVADAIRAKKGTTDLINPQDFAEEIGAISGGGEGEGGGSSWRYFDFTGYKDDILSFSESFPVFTHSIRFIRNGQDMVAPLAVFFLFVVSNERLKEIKAIGVDMSAKVKNNPLSPTATTMAEVFATDLGGITLEQGMKDIWGLVEITEDEFLNKTFD